MRPTNYERVMTVVNATKGKRVATVDIAKAIKVPVAKVRLWLLEWASKGMLCVNKDGVVSRKRGPSIAKHLEDPRQLDLPFEVHGDPACPRDKIFVVSNDEVVVIQLDPSDVPREDVHTDNQLPEEDENV